MVVMLLKQRGDNLTRENLLEQASHLKDVAIPMLLPGIPAQHLVGRLFADQTDAIAALRWRRLGEDRRRCRQVAPSARKIDPPGGPQIFLRENQHNHGDSWSPEAA
jgi:hypothetical protein